MPCSCPWLPKIFKSRPTLAYDISNKPLYLRISLLVGNPIGWLKTQQNMSQKIRATFSSMFSPFLISWTWGQYYKGLALSFCRKNRIYHIWLYISISSLTWESGKCLPYHLLKPVIDRDRCRSYNISFVVFTFIWLGQSHTPTYQQVIQNITGYLWHCIALSIMVTTQAPLECNFKYCADGFAFRWCSHSRDGSCVSFLDQYPLWVN